MKKNKFQVGSFFPSKNSQLHHPSPRYLALAVSLVILLFLNISSPALNHKIKELTNLQGLSELLPSQLDNSFYLDSGSSLPWSNMSAQEDTKRYLIRVRGKREKLQALASRPLDLASSAIKDFIDIIVTENEIKELLASDYQIEIIQTEREAAYQGLDPLYHTYEQTVSLLFQAENIYSHIAKVFLIGRSTRFNLPIYALKISDNVLLDEDEFTFLVDGMHHAREPLGNEICLAFIEYLLNNYGREPRVTRWVDDYEIWVIPILNPEGYKYIVDNNLSSPWWRKNLRDNNNNGRIDPDYDGVDLNRNYDYNWYYGGSTNPSDWTYRGPFAFSEKETQAKRDLALRERFVASISYHSYGEEVMYCWSWPESGARAPDHDLLYEIASETAKRIKNEAGTGNYSLARLTGANQSPIWMYGHSGTLEFLIETGTSFIPPGYKIKPIVEANLEGLFYLLERLKGPGITGRVLDLTTRRPIDAEVSILEIDNFNFIQPRTNKPSTGRFVRLLKPGKYTLLVASPDHLYRFLPLTIGQESLTKEISLMPEGQRWPRTEKNR